MMLSTLPHVTSSAEGIPDEQYVLPLAPNPNVVGLYFVDHVSRAQLAPGFLGADASLNSLDAQNFPTATQGLCDSSNDALCIAGAQIVYYAHLPRCLHAADVDCIVGIYAIKPNGVRVEGIYIHGMPEKPSNQFLGNPELGIPQSGVDGLWSLPEVINGAGTDTYLVDAQKSGGIIKERNSSLSQRIPLYFFGAGITPVKSISGNFTPAIVALASSPNGTVRWTHYSAAGQGVEVCAGVSSSECARREAFPPNVVFGLSLRLSGGIPGWLHGRILNPLITHERNSSSTLFTVQALPVSIPVVAGYVERSTFLKLPEIQFMQPVRDWSAYTPGPSAANSASWLELLLPHVGEKAQANPTAWRFDSLSYSSLLGANACMNDPKSLVGFVTTNSTVYSAGPPSFNPVTESLDYTLVSPHFTSKGEVFKGAYNLVIRSDVARCIYNFTDAPVQAIISVTDQSGQKTVAVESMSEHDGWIYLSASGFTFSSPTVHVKLIGTPILKVPTLTTTPSTVATPTEPSTPSPTSTTFANPIAKRFTITCVKGKTVKKVTSVKPICPKGYTKK
ncbi:MAG: hypothetical protein F2954_00710 [Actinobacteria bacterium]|nr:hypothetical protein [Actinomycetota bacterium]